VEATTTIVTPIATATPTPTPTPTTTTTTTTTIAITTIIMEVSVCEYNKTSDKKMSEVLSPTCSFQMVSET